MLMQSLPVFVGERFVFLRATFGDAEFLSSPTSTFRRSVLWNINNLVSRVATTFRYCVAGADAPVR